MIIKVPGLNRKESAGGGSTFIRNFEKAMMKFGHRLVSEDEQNFDFLLIPGQRLLKDLLLRKLENEEKVSFSVLIIFSKTQETGARACLVFWTL